MKDSILLNGFKSFIKGFFTITGIFFAVAIAFIVISFFSSKQESKKTSLKILPDLEGNTHLLAEKYPVILQIDIKGIIGKNLSEETIKEKLIESRKNLLRNNRVKGILLNINTPGGEVTATDGIYRALIKYKEKYNVPIFAYVDGLCASGGFYISAAADKIYATPTSIIGSLGVRMGPFFNLFQTMQKIGVEALTLTNGKDKDSMNPFRKWKETESDNFKKISTDIYDRFINIISKARKIDKNILVEKYGANVFLSEDAEKIKYIDYANASYEKAVTALLKESKIDIETPYQIVQLKIKKKLFSEMLHEVAIPKKIKHEINLKNKNELNNDFPYMYILN